jgi:hypothetical protein
LTVWPGVTHCWCIISCNQRNKSTLSWVWLWHPHLLVAGWAWRYPLHARPLCLRVILINLTFISCNIFVQPLLILLSLLQKSVHSSLLWCSSSLGRVLVNIYTQTSFIHNFLIKISHTVSLLVFCSAVILTDICYSTAEFSPFQCLHLILILLDIQVDY